MQWFVTQTQGLTSTKQISEPYDVLNHTHANANQGNSENTFSIEESLQLFNEETLSSSDRTVAASTLTPTGATTAVVLDIIGHYPPLSSGSWQRMALEDL